VSVEVRKKIIPTVLGVECLELRRPRHTESI
jgi:hypothetical protein